MPIFWTIINPDTPSETWMLNQDAASDGATSMLIPGENMSPNSIEILESPAYDFKNNQGAELNFKYAYAKYSPTNKDVFKVQASKNCGGSWIDVWTPSNNFLATGSGSVTTDIYLSPASNEWKSFEITTAPNFQTFRTEDNVKIRFFFQENVGGSGPGNRFYLDEVIFATPTGINQLSKSFGFNIWPNPAGSEFRLGFRLSDAATVKYHVLSVTGSVMLESKAQTYPVGSHELILNSKQELNRGIYFVNFEVNGAKMSRKLIIN
jgi:hypothetical protein